MNNPPANKDKTHGTHLTAAESRIGCQTDDVKTRKYARLSPGQRELIIHLMMERDGLAGACRQARIPLALVLAERRQNASFRRALAAAEKERHALLQMLLTDLAVRGLLPDGEEGKSEAREKFLSSLAQALIERSIAARDGESSAKSSEVTKKPARGGRKARSPLGDLPLGADELDRLLAETEARIAAAEAELATQTGAEPASGQAKTA